MTDLESDARNSAVPSDISRRIDALRYLLICGIAVVHVLPIQPLPLVFPNLSAFEWIKAYLAEAFFRGAVPMLTCMSGYLTFLFLERQRYSTLLARRARTLVVPLVIWNLVNLSIAFVLVYFQVVERRFHPPVYPFEFHHWLQGTFGLTDLPALGILFFLRDLFVLNVLAPVLLLLIRRTPYLGLIGVMVVFFPGWDGPLLLRDTMAINFYVGGMAAVLAWDVRLLDRYWVPCLIGMVLLPAVVLGLNSPEIDWYRVIAPLLVWPVSVRLVRGWLGNWAVARSPASFAVFLTHSMFLVAFWDAFKAAGDPLPYPLFWIAALVASIACAHALRWVAFMIWPQAARLAFGGR